MKQWPKRAWIWLRLHILNKESILPGILGELTYWSPLIVLAFLALLKDPWYWTVFGTCWAFWVTLLPAIPIQLLFIAGYKWLFKRLKNKPHRNETKSEYTDTPYNTKRDTRENNKPYERVL